MTAPAQERALAPSAVNPAVAASIEVYEGLKAVRNALGLIDFTDQEIQLFAMVAQRSRLDPFAKQIYAIKRKGRMTFQTGIDGFRGSAEDTGEYRGSDEPEFGPWVEKPVGHPEWASVTVHRQYPDGTWLHQPAKVYWDEFVVEGDQGFQWRKMPRVMLAKCAEAAAFRKAFPKRFGDVYAPEEMHQADAAQAARPVAPTAREAAAQRRAEIEAATTRRPADSAAGMAQSEPKAATRARAGTAVEQPATDPTGGGAVSVAGAAPDDAIDGEFTEAVETVAEAAPAEQCAATSPYEGHARCRDLAGHEGLHRSGSRESWSDPK